METSTPLSGEVEATEVNLYRCIYDNLQIHSILYGQIVQLGDSADAEEWIHLHFTWAGKPFEIDVAGSDRWETYYFQTCNY